MNARVHDRGTQVGGLLRYLYGPGKSEEHVDPHLVAGWAGCGVLAALEPRLRADGRHEVGRLAGLLDQPLRAARDLPKLTVWHCSVRTAPEDRTLTDAEWRDIAVEMMAGVGLAPKGDLNAVRWVAVRHADNHIHIVATLVRQDGRTAWGRRDWPKSRAVAVEMEQRYGLRQTGPGDHTGHRRPRPSEVHKARRLGKALTARDELRRRVRAALVGSVNEAEFFARLTDAGVQVKFRPSVKNPGENTGYKVALADDTTAAGGVVWFGGGQLAPDLTLPKLRQRWAAPDGTLRTENPRVRVSAAARVDALRQAARALNDAAVDIGRLGTADPQAAKAAVQSTADVLATVAHAVEGRGGGVLTDAAELMDKAAREPGGWVARATDRSHQLRSMARLIHLMGRISGDEDTYALLALLLDVARFGDTLASLREAQHRLHQATAARKAAVLLRAAVAGGGRLAPNAAITSLDLTATPDQPGEPVTPGPSTSDRGRQPRPGR